MDIIKIQWMSNVKIHLADSKNELFLETDLQIANLAVLKVLQYRIISFTSQPKGHSTIYCVGSLVEKLLSLYRSICNLHISFI
jgi:hypothetical protein